MASKEKVLIEVDISDIDDRNLMVLSTITGIFQNFGDEAESTLVLKFATLYDHWGDNEMHWLQSYPEFLAGVCHDPSPTGQEDCMWWQAGQKFSHKVPSHVQDQLMGLNS